MPWIHYLPDKQKVEVDPDETVLQASLRARIPHAHACGGNARCSTCRVQIIEGLPNCQPPDLNEQKLAERLHLNCEVRLGCQMHITGDVTLRRLLRDAEDVEISAGITKSEGPVSLGEEKTVAILFADIRNFTAFAESQPAYDVIYVLNRYFHEMGRIIQRRGGYIDNYMGDGLIALFGVDESRHAAKRAIQAGFEMLRSVKKMSAFLQEIYSAPLEIGIGIHYGQAIVGSIGAKEKKRMTAIGDAVNLASRIEAATKTCDASILVSEAALRAVRSSVRIEKKYSNVHLKGKSGSHTLYEIAGFRSRKKPAKMGTAA